ncbi:hypothetical protein [Lysinibacillus yapensis]|uniref:hypothetical protein n=1 Tax=Ureibacillus yapensis TaxID=2304605 RepID=UPI0011C49A45|nr:hypothetical protein [Lysinibacillus yapensis]
MLSNTDLITLEKKYFDILEKHISCNLGSILTQINNQKLISSSPTGARINRIEHAIENIIESLISRHLQWHISSMTISSDSCFEVGDAIVHIDSKTISNDDGDAINNKVTIEKAQTSYDSQNQLFVSGMNWLPLLNHYESHDYFGEVPNFNICR